MVSDGDGGGSDGGDKGQSSNRCIVGNIFYSIDTSLLVKLAVTFVTRSFVTRNFSYRSRQTHTQIHYFGMLV